MELLISISTNELETVIRRTVNTILLPYGSKDAYVAESNGCYAKVAVYLRSHWDDSWTLMYFAGHATHVAHACLYDGHKKLVDTFEPEGGKPHINGHHQTVYYTPTHTYPSLLVLTLGEFKQRYLKGG